MLIGARNALLAGGAALPYDAEVEYLESTGTQWIDTGVIFTPQSKMVVTMAFQRMSSGIADAQQTGFVKGSDSGNYRAVISYDSGNINFYAVDLSKRIAGVSLTKHTYTLDYPGKFIKIDNSTTGISTALTGSFSHSFYLFARNNSNVPELFCYMKLYSAQFSDNTTPLRDFIPVRVGSGASAVGYMYDRVSGELFRNAGTGAFVIGPDASAANGGGV